MKTSTVLAASATLFTSTLALPAPQGTISWQLPHGTGYPHWPSGTGIIPSGTAPHNPTGPTGTGHPHPPPPATTSTHLPPTPPSPGVTTTTYTSTVTHLVTSFIPQSTLVGNNGHEPVYSSWLSSSVVPSTYIETITATVPIPTNIWGASNGNGNGNGAGACSVAAVTVTEQLPPVFVTITKTVGSVGEHPTSAPDVPIVPIESPSSTIDSHIPSHTPSPSGLFGTGSTGYGAPTGWAPLPTGGVKGVW